MCQRQRHRIDELEPTPIGNGYDVPVPTRAPQRQTRRNVRFPRWRSGLTGAASLIGTDCEHVPLLASILADNVSTQAAPLAVNRSRKWRCLRARAPMFASSYS